MKLRTTILVAMLAMSVCCCDQNPTIAVLENAVQSGKYLFGHQDDVCYGHSWHFETGAAIPDSLEMSDVKLVCGDFPAVLGFDLGGIEIGDSCNLDGVDFDLIREAAIMHAGKGGIITFSWHLRNPLTGGSAWDVTSDQVVTSVLEGGQCHEKFMGWLSNLADFLQSMTGPQGKTLPVIFRPWHEHMGSWFWWGRNLCSVEQYTALWAMTYDYIVNTRRIDNLVWAFSPSAGVSEDEYMERYPGNRMVDILGLDGYQTYPQDDYIAKIGNCLSYMTKLGQKHGKLIALTETGYEGMPDPEWWTGTLAPAIESFPISYVLTWRNAWDRPDHFFGPCPGCASERDFVRFFNSPKTVFLNDID